MDTRSAVSATILLIEDDSAVIDVLRPALELEGYRVHLAEEPPTARDLARLRPDLLVVDVAPDGPASNWQIVREVVNRSLSPDLSIIVYGGDGAFVSSEDVRSRSRATAVLARPVRLDVLLPVVSTALERRRPDWRLDLPHLHGDPVPESSWGW